MKHYAEMHLYRGAPAVRGWSRYQQTMRDWTLCGISPTGPYAPASENAADVTCAHCLQLLAPASYDKPWREPQAASAAAPPVKPARDITTEDGLLAFARRHKLKVRRDECGDAIIPGRRGQSQLYFDNGQLCLLVIAGRPAIRSRWEILGGKLWLGEISSGVQDVKITGIAREQETAAIRMALVKPRRTMSEAQAAVLARATAHSLAKRAK
jgi:hypothetical protein